MNTLIDLLKHEIQDLYSAEEQLIEALPKMAEAASNPQLQEAFREHLKETQTQAKRLSKAAGLLGISPEGEKCNAMAGLIEEGEEVAKITNKEVRDAALIAAAQRVEHYEMAAYGSVVAFAKQVKKPDVEELVKTTLDEEKAADSKLNKLAESGVNQTAA